MEEVGGPWVPRPDGEAVGPGWGGSKGQGWKRAGRAEPEKVAETTLGRIKRQAGWVRIGEGKGEQGTAKLCSIRENSTDG